ncbi:Metaxin-2 [Batrachochytrium dendrobatidis]|nr:Metaxin-2 [Batrachochytrium dendrobatidis]
MDSIQSVLGLNNLPEFPLITFPPVFEPTEHPTVAVLYVLPASKEHFTSQDYQCLKYQTYLKFAKYPHTIKEHTEHSFSPSGKLPALLTSSGRLLSGCEIISEVKSKNGLESNASAEDKAKMNAFDSLIESHLSFGLDYELWYESSHFENIIAPIIGAYYPWPLNFILPRIQRSQKIAWMLSRKPVLKAEEIYGETNQALGNLELVLENGPYLFGATPTLVDASLFAYLHIVMTMLKHSSMESQLTKYVLDRKNLVKYLHQIRNEWYGSYNENSL